MTAATDGFFTGDDERTSAKRRRQEAYKKDLQLQMLEQDAARKRERIQDMSVNASGYLDPEKGPERLKPLGGGGFMTDRTNRESKVRAYHTLFNYDKLPKNPGAKLDEVRVQPGALPAMGPMINPGARVPDIKVDAINLDPPAGLTIQPLTNATTGAQPYPSSNQDAYNFYATRDLDRPVQQYGSIIPPLTIPYVDNRPIIMPGRYDSYPMDTRYRYNPFENYDGLFRDIKNLIGAATVVKQKPRDDDDYYRRLKRDLEDERRRLMEQEAEARRRIEDLRREAEERRKEWERRMREAELNKQPERPKTELVVVRPQSSTSLLVLEDMRRRLAEERRKIEELLKMQKAPDYTHVKILKRPPPPPTPIDPDKAEARNIMEFQDLKHRDQKTRNVFRRLYPEDPETNRRLENQQQALLAQQEESLSKKRTKKAPPGVVFVEHGLKRPAWLDKTPTPFPHRLRLRDRLYTTSSLHGDIDRIYRKNTKRERAIDVDGETDGFDHLRLRSHRPSSTDTLTDDTWLRPSSVL